MTEARSNEHKSELEEAREQVRALEAMMEKLTRDLHNEHLKAEDASRRMMSILHSMYCGVLVTNEQLELELVNNISEQVLGIQLVDLLQAKLTDIFPFDELRQSPEERFYLLHGLEKEFLYQHPVTGKKIPLLVSFSPFIYHEESSAGIVCLCTDLTRRKSLEHTLLQAQKLESIGTLAAGIAHEINTPIQYIRDNTAFIRDEVPRLLNLIKEMRTCDGVTCTLETIQDKIKGIDFDFLEEQIPLALDQTLGGTNSVAKIVRSLKEFSHPGAQQKEPINLNAAIESTLTISRNEWKYVADLEFVPDPTIPSMICFPGELNQAFLNIIVNAAHAIGEKVKAGKMQKGKMRVATQYLPDGALVLISDNGMGIEKEIQNKIFDPFFTTKEVGQGTGQGLALVHRFICDRHGGKVSFESEPGIGTTFSIFIPFKDSEGKKYDNSKAQNLVC